jgi:Flp pilus assembly protein TadG
MRLTDCLRFFRHQAGGVAVIVALTLIPILAASGAAIDFGRAYAVKARLTSALDAAGLAVGKSTPADAPRIFARFFAANYPAEKLGVPVNPTVTIVGGEIRLTAEARVKTAFLKIIRIPEITVVAQSTIIRETKDLEIVLVLDNTGSMRINNRIGALRAAAQEMVDIVFGTEDEPEDLLMALVPFVTTVNIGNGLEIRRFVDFPIAPEDPTRTNEYAEIIDTEWKGCVEARPDPNDTNDVFLRGDDARGNWSPYFWEAETIFDQRGRFTQCQNTWWQPSDTSRLPPLPRPTGRAGDPPFASGLGGEGGNVNNGNNLVDVTPVFTRGPNKACPQALTSLTNDRTRLEEAIEEMTPWSGNGTMAHLGAVWGLRVLSPGAPFTVGAPFDDPNVNKVMVILTDGRNLISSANRRCTNTNQKYDSHYTGYGYVSEGKLGTTNIRRVEGVLNQKLRRTCGNIKRTGITIFTIVFGVEDRSIQNLFRECASAPENFFNSPNNDELRGAFRAIGAKLSNLRIGR